MRDALCVAFQEQKFLLSQVAIDDQDDRMVLLQLKLARHGLKSLYTIDSYVELGTLVR